MTSIKNRIRSHIADTDSHYRRIALGFISVSIFVFLGKLAGAAKEIAIAWRYGISQTVDSYVFVFNLITFPVSIWLSVLTVVLVPLIGRMRNNNREQLSQFRRELLGLTLCIGIGLGIIIWLGLPYLLQWARFGFTAEAIAETIHIIKELVLIIPLGILINLFSAWMLAFGIHRNTLFEGLPALAILAAVLLPMTWISRPLIWGTIAGYAVHLSALCITLWRKKELQLPEFSFNNCAWKEFWNSMGIVVLGQIFMSLTTIIDQFYAAQLETGAISTMSYANRILSLILGMGALAITRATLPVFSDMKAKNSINMRKAALHIALSIFCAGAFLSLVLWQFSPYIISLIYERGAFLAIDSHAVYQLFQYGLLQVPFYISGLVFVSLLSSIGYYRCIASVAIINCIVKLIANYILIDEFGVRGLFISTVIMYFISMMLCLILVLKFIRK